MVNYLKKRMARFDDFLIIIVLIFVGLLYIVTMPIQFFMYEPAVELAAAMSQNLIFMARHLLTTLVYKGLLQIDTYLGIEPNFIFAQLFDIVLGITAAYIFYITQTYLKIAKKTATYLTLIFLLTNAVWLHTIEIVADIHAQFFLIIFIYFLVVFLFSEKSELKNAIYSYIGLCFSILFCLNFVFFIPGFMVSVFIKVARDKIKLKKMTILLTILTLIFLVVPFCSVALYLEIHSFSNVVKWLVYHPDSTKLSFLHTFGIEFILRPLAGIFSLFINAEQSIAILKASIKGIDITEHVVRELPLLLFSLCFLIILGVFALKGLIRLSNKPFRYFIFISFLLFTVFNFYWLGSDPKFWLPILPIFIILIGNGFRTTDNKLIKNRYAYILYFSIPILLIYYNLPAKTPSLLYPQGGYQMRLANEFIAKSHRSLIFTPGVSWPDFIAKISNQNKVIDLVYSNELQNGPAFLSSIDNQIETALQQQKSVYFDDLLPPFISKQNGMWILVSSGRGVSREELLAYLQKKYILKPSCMGLTKIKRLNSINNL